MKCKLSKNRKKVGLIYSSSSLTAPILGANAL